MRGDAKTAMPLFKSSPKSPQELVKSLREAMTMLSMHEGGARKAEKVSKGRGCSYS